jgi:poly(ADP-ribose) glycohydrolase ARH3
MNLLIAGRRDGTDRGRREDVAIDLKSKFLGGMVGSALGDAIGELAFSYGDEPALRAVVARTRPLVYTDDTAMAMGLAASIARCGQIDEQHLGDAFRANYRREPWRGYASGPPTVFSLVERLGLSYSEAARSLFGRAVRRVPVLRRAERRGSGYGRGDGLCDLGRLPGGGSHPCRLARTDRAPPGVGGPGARSVGALSI